MIQTGVIGKVEGRDEMVFSQKGRSQCQSKRATWAFGAPCHQVPVSCVLRLAL